MNSHQTEGHENEEKGKVGQPDDKATGDKGPQNKGKAGQHGGKSRSVLGEINDDPKKESE